MTSGVETIPAEEVTIVAEPALRTTDAVANDLLTERQRKSRYTWLVVLGAVYLVSILVPRTSLPHVPICWLRALTGLSCPTCGMTRAFTEIGHGNFAAASEFNLLAVPIFVLGLALAAVLVVELVTRRNWLCPWAARHRIALLLIGASCVLLRYVPTLLAS